jgi:cell division protein FtsL
MLAKFFVMDFRTISMFAKVMSLLFLGGIMLAVSFMYTQVKKVVLEGDVSDIRNSFDRNAKFESPTNNEETKDENQR